MKNINIVIIGVFVCVVLLFSAVFGTLWYTTYSEALQNKVLIDASYTNLQGIFDNTYKKINQSTQIAKFDRESVKDIIVQNAQARGGGGSVVKWVQESIPNVDSTTLRQLISIVNGARDEYLYQQTGYNDKVRNYNSILATPIVGFLLTHVNGLKPIDYLAITSTHTENAFKTHKDDDVDLNLSK